jgi:hypothetical protein
MGCGADAETHDSKELRDTNNNVIGLVQIRESGNCLAQWEKTINSSGSNQYAEGSIRWGEPQYSAFIHPVDGYTLDGQWVYTAMYGEDAGLGPSLNCGALSNTGPIYPPKQPITPGSPYYLNNCVAR